MTTYSIANQRFGFVLDDIVLYDRHHDEFFCLFSGLVLMRNNVSLVSSDEYEELFY